MPEAKDTAIAVRLRPLNHADEHGVRRANLAMAGDNFNFAFDLGPDTDWSDYLSKQP